jgi:hypothetical protein
MKSSDLMRQYIDLISERVTIDADGNQVGGFKPTEPSAAPQTPVPAAPPSSITPATPNVEIDRTTNTLTYQGREYEITTINKNGPQPRIPPNNVRIRVPLAGLGFRSIGTVQAVLYGDRAYVYMP